MPRKARQLGEALLTVRALERSLATVSQHVPVKYLKLCETLPAFCTRVRTLPGVDLLVLVPEPHMREAFATLTSKWPLPCVFHLVSLEVRRSAVDLLTQGAFVLTHHHVLLPVPQPLQDATEALVTFLAFVLTTHFL